MKIYDEIDLFTAKPYYSNEEYLSLKHLIYPLMIILRTRDIVTGLSKKS
jgi:hypothetical protein